MSTVLIDDLQFVQFVMAATNDMIRTKGEMSIEVPDEVDRALIERLRNRKPSLLRFALPVNSDTWLLTGFDEAEISRTAFRLKHFLTPTYGRFTHTIDEIQRFDALSTVLKPLARTLGMPGFYKLETDAHLRPEVLRALGAWIHLEESRPVLERLVKPTYRDVLASFQRALATSAWDEATRHLDQISRFRLTTADNIVFLHIQLLAAQENWKAIWESAQFVEWSKQRIPRKIRTALITAYHYSELLALEVDGNWQGALEVFRGTRHRLGRLLETRLQEQSIPVVRVFAYMAVDTEDHLLANGLRSTLADEVLAGILPILELMPPEEPAEIVAVSPDQAAANLLYVIADLDSAREMIGNIESPIVRASFLVDLAERTRDVYDAQLAVDAFGDLRTWERNDLLQSKPYHQHQIDMLKANLGRKQPSDHSIGSWVEWLERAAVSAPDVELESGLDLLLEQSDERMWEPTDARAISNSVQSIVLDELLTAKAVVKQGIWTLADHLLLDEQFPRPGHTYAELYEALYTFILEVGRANESESKLLVRYAEAILTNDPGRVAGISAQIRAWFLVPRPVLLDAHLDALELLGDFGLNGRSLIGHVRQWIEAMLVFTSSLEESTLRAWAEFSSSIDAGDDLVSALRGHEGVAQSSFAHAVAQLPERFRIAIFTLRPKSAERVRSVLLAMNPKLDVQISEEKDLSPRAKQLAESADLPVIVTTCITHALTYGIGPHMKVEPIRPASSGSTSIVRAIQEALERIIGQGEMSPA